VKAKWRSIANSAGGVLALSLATAVNAAPPEIVVLSNRADLISGGDALVEIRVPPWISAARGVKIDVDGVNANSAFAVRADGRYYGLITGLRNGDNVVRAVTPGGTATLTIRNHPIGGPVFSGAQVSPVLWGRIRSCAVNCSSDSRSRIKWH